MRIIELFAGIGACSKALENLGIDLEIVDAVEIDKYAIASFNAIHGTNFEPQDITKWDKDFKDIDIITHGSPCFLAGEKVNTKYGFKNIEDIKIEDYVKSHNGTYNKVTRIFKNFSNNIYNIKCSATHNINTTGNHPFYILRNNRKGWIQSKELTKDDFMCVPINKNQNDVDNINTNLPLDSIRFWYLIGRFIGDGWVTKRKDRNYNISGIKICCAKDELEDLQNKLCNIIHYCVVEDKSTYKLQFTNKELGEFCSEFGLGAKNKHIPQWVLDLKTEYLEYLLMGIIDSDGCYSQNKYKVTTISRDLVYNIGELVLKVKKVPYHIYKTIRPSKYKIENRIVNQNNTYQITWSNIYNKNINFVDNDYLYSKIQKIESIDKLEPVYNIEVENTHSYCINNIATHNCQDFSAAGKQQGGDKDSGTRSSLMYETLRIVEKIKPKYVLWENVKNILSKKHRHNFENYLSKMEQLGYTNYYQVLNAKDYLIPQNRQRVFTISIRNDIKKSFNFPEKQELKLRLKDMLEDEVDEKYYLSNLQIDKIKQSNFMQNRRRIQEKDYCDTLCARDWKDPKCVRVGNIYGRNKGTSYAGNIYDKEGISPTLNTMQGGNTQPMIEVIGNYSPSGHNASRIVDSLGIAPTVMENHGTITAVAQLITTYNSYVEKKYEKFVKENGYIPEMFNPYNNKEITDIAPTQTTQCGNIGSSATVLKIDIPQIVKVRKYQVDTKNLVECLRKHKELKKYTNSFIANYLNVPLTKVEHWFRNDNSFAIPDSEIWLKLKDLLGINENTFDLSIMTFEEKEGIYEKANRCYYEDGISPTITCESGEEKIITSAAQRGRNPSNPNDRTKGCPTEQRIEISDKEVSNCITTAQKDSLIAIRDGFEVTDNKKIILGSTQKHASINEDGIVPTLTSAMGEGGGHIPMHNYDLRVRKLTPKEVWRLMAFSDEDFEKAKSVPMSNRQLYKQAGNSIVVSVLEAIFKNLFLGG